ncbi:hypothetical protein VV02_19970 [Luteipulveratus mongoliensis]|uniref:Uncharacterized protein n=1 Tax=Luteipulveratus mongoliensis TaxID=571913 RepID=A0A0K1JLJ9_9MICO|nr:hypothetical protein VV02_19970 [Luteipulveratus mongoliensis]
MSQPPARETLKVVLAGDEVPGLIAYGLRGSGDPADATFPTDSWIAQPEPTELTLHGDAWEVQMWEIPVVIWPARADMELAVRATLRTLIGVGCRVAWIGAEGLPFCDPPELFEPQCMSGSVLAWMTDSGASDCQLDPDAPVMPVGDDVLRVLRAHGSGLADAT